MLMVCISKVHALCGRVCCTYGVGFGVVVWNEGQYQSLDERNSNSAVPLFVYKCNAFVLKAEHYLAGARFFCCG